MTIQVAENWRNFKWPAGPGALSNAPTEFMRRPELGTVLSGVRADQLGGAAFGNVPGSATPGAQLLPGFAPVPATPPAPAQPHGELPLDHDKMSSLNCASCHPGMVNPQGTVSHDALKLSESIFSPHVIPPAGEVQPAVTVFNQSSIKTAAQYQSFRLYDSLA